MKMSMVRKDFTISSRELDKLAQCPAAGVYRLETDAGRRKPTFPEWYGIFVHRFIQYATTQGRDAALKYIRTKKMKGVISCCEKIDTDALPLGPVEVPYAHDVFADTARSLVGGDGSAGVDVMTEQYGRADVVAELRNAPFVLDYKTGAVDKRDPQDSTQLLGLAASIRGSWDHRKPKPDRYFIGLGGVLGTGDIMWAIVAIDDDSINSYVRRTRQIHLRVLEDRRKVDAQGTVDFVRGDECTFCDLKPICPAHK